MSELRQNMATGEWVIIATGRSGKPIDFKPASPRPKPAEREEACPFCPGNEKQTPEQLFSLPLQGGGAGGTGWNVRVVTNKYPALLPSPGRAAVPRRLPESPYMQMAGAGYHEVIVEHPRHDRTLAQMTPDEVRLVLTAYRQRYRQLAQDPNNLLITLFRNYGEGAGASLHHPHSQLITTGIVPLAVHARLQEAQRYFHEAKSCAYCDMVRFERREKERVVLENEAFVVLVPYAAASPYETWILPKRHRAAFGDIPDEDLGPWAQALQGAAARLARLLGDPDFNLLLQTAPYSMTAVPHYHWHHQILPHLTTRRAGFEISSGIGINIVSPEAAAKGLREAVP